MKLKYIYGALVFTMAFMACEPSFDNEIGDKTYSKGNADFTTYVAVGNSLTAGAMDGTVFKKGQVYSFPNILSKQFAVVGGGTFTQPSYEDDINNLGGLTLGGNPLAPTRIIINTALDKNAKPIGPQNIKGVPTIEVTKLQAKAYNNMGIPLAKSFHLILNGFGNVAGLQTATANPYFVRHATSPNATVIEDATSLNPTFFTNWIGSNDVLSYATSGGVGVYQKDNMDVSQYSEYDITSPAVFAAVYSNIVNALTVNNAKGVLITIPGVTNIPFFTTVPFNAISPELFKDNEDGFTQLNGFIEQFKMVLKFVGQEDRLQLLSLTKPNPLLIKDKDLDDLSSIIEFAVFTQTQNPTFAKFVGETFGQARHATENDLILLSTAKVIGSAPPNANEMFAIYGISYPLEDEHVLTMSEQEKISDAIMAYNTVIKNIAQEKALAVADMNEIMAKLVSGIKVEDGQIYTADYFKGLTHLNSVMFSLDGIHPNARGYALIANEIIRTINTYYKSNIPIVSIGNYVGPTLLPSN